MEVSMSEQNQAKSLKSFSPEQLEKAISEAIASLTGYTEVVCKLNGFDYGDASDYFKDIVGDKLNCSINITATRYEDFITKQAIKIADEIKRKEENNKNGMVDF